MNFTESYLTENIFERILYLWHPKCKIPAGILKGSSNILNDIVRWSTYFFKFVRFSYFFYYVNNINDLYQLNIG